MTITFREITDETFLPIVDVIQKTTPRNEGKLKNLTSLPLLIRQLQFI